MTTKLAGAPPFATLLLGAGLTLMVGGCSDAAPASNGASAGSGASSGTAGAGAIGGGGGSAGTATGGVPGAAGDLVVGGGGSSSGAGAATGGTAGAGGSGGGVAVFGKLSCTPGTDGDGVHMTSDTVPPEWKLKDGVAQGEVTDSVEYESTVYDGYKFPYRVYTSANYVKGEPALLLVFGDGGMYVGGGYKTPTVLDNLTAEGALLPIVAVFVDPGPDRVEIYDPPTDKYARFLTEELLPKAILPSYSVSLDPEAWATAGYSASGEAGFAVVWHRPEQFHKFFGHSASFGASIRYDNWVWADKLAQSPKRELRVSLVVAAQGDLTDDRGSWRTINENVAKALEAKGNPYRLIIGPGDHGGLASQQDFPNALRWMWKGCSFVQ
jgi:enterochelin esterase-like enzyme